MLYFYDAFVLLISLAMNKLFDLCNRVIVITGGTGVLGSQIAKYLASEKAKVVVIGRNKEKGNKLVGEIGKEALFLSADVLNREQLEESYDMILSKYQKIDVLINAAGGNQAAATIPAEKTIFDLSASAMQDVVNLNLMGTVLPTTVFAKSMTQNKKGSIINFSSEAALRPLTRVVGYGAAKAAVTNFTQYMATELASKYGAGLRVNAICPGFFLTEQNRTLLTNPDGSLTDRAEQILHHTPFKRFGVPEDLFGTIHWLASDASAFVTGTLTVVDGGFNAFAI